MSGSDVDCKLSSERKFHRTNSFDDDLKIKGDDDDGNVCKYMKI